MPPTSPPAISSTNAANGPTGFPAIDQDIAALEARWAKAGDHTVPGIYDAILEAQGRSRRAPAACRHKPPASFRPNADISLAIAVENGRKIAAVKLYYRHVNQAERWQDAEMAFRGNQYEAPIPAAYTVSPYALQYYFELREGPQNAWLHPGFTPALTNQPYFVLRPA